MAAENHVHPVPQEYRLQAPTARDPGPRVPAGRIERMVEEADLPVRVRVFKLPIEPGQLFRVQSDRIDREKLHDVLFQRTDRSAGLVEREVAMAAGVEWRVPPLLADVVIAPRREKLYAVRHQTTVRHLELVAVV